MVVSCQHEWEDRVVWGLSYPKTMRISRSSLDLATRPTADVGVEVVNPSPFELEAMGAVVAMVSEFE